MCAVDGIRRELAQLPKREGGLGLLSVEAISPIAYASSQAASIALLRERAPQRELETRQRGCAFVDDRLLAHSLALIDTAEMKMTAELLGKTTDAMWSLKTDDTTRLQNRATVKWGRRQWYNVFHRLPSAAMQYRLVDFGSRMGRAWLSALPLDRRNVLGDSDVMLQLRYRLDLMMRDYNPHQGSRDTPCECEPRYPWNPEHAQVCQRNSAKALHTRRHNDFLHALAKNVELSGGVATVEHTVGAAAGRMDLTVEDGDDCEHVTQLLAVGPRGQPGRELYDLAIIGPPRRVRENRRITPTELQALVQSRKDGASTHGNSMQQQRGNSWRAAAQKLLFGDDIRRTERRKRNHYGSMAEASSDDDLLNTGNFQPLVMTSGGSMSETLEAWVSKMVEATVKATRRHPDYAIGQLGADNLHDAGFITSTVFQRLSQVLLRHFKDYFPPALVSDTGGV